MFGFLKAARSNSPSQRRRCLRRAERHSCCARFAKCPALMQMAFATACMHGCRRIAGHQGGSWLSAHRRQTSPAALFEAIAFASGIGQGIHHEHNPSETGYDSARQGALALSAKHEGDDAYGIGIMRLTEIINNFGDTKLVIKTDQESGLMNAGGLCKIQVTAHRRGHRNRSSRTCLLGGASGAIQDATP